MKKLKLDALTVDSFATSPAAPSGGGTVLGREATPTCPPESFDCPYSWDGTCWITCWESCPCDTGFHCG